MGQSLPKPLIDWEKFSRRNRKGVDKNSVTQTEDLAPIVRGLSQSKPNYNDLSVRLLQFFGYEELGCVLAERRQDWQSVFCALRSKLIEEAAWIRIETVLRSLSATPQELDQLAQTTGLSRTTISQTINALERGGYAISFEHSPDRDGRPRKAFLKR